MKNKIDKRRINRENSLKRGGNSDKDSLKYLDDLGISITEAKQPISFSPNLNEIIHRWAPYVQGFSASFVQSIIEQYRYKTENPIILDPFAGCGTVLVQSKINRIKSIGTELNPLLSFISNTKLNSWIINPSVLLKEYESLHYCSSSPPPYLDNEKHFNPIVLKNLLLIKGAIENYKASTELKHKIKDIFLLAFSSILVECSNLKRSPCLGYSRNKKVEDSAPFVLFSQKINQIAEDLSIIRNYFSDNIKTQSEIYTADSAKFIYPENINLVITSPPYMNGLDYVINYKIEMGWLNFVQEYSELKTIKDQMVVCDNVSKILIKDFSDRKDVFQDSWIDSIKNEISYNIDRRGAYRRQDMPNIVHKYFDDMFRIMSNISKYLHYDSKFILVVGDSLIADTYIPTDLLIAKIGKELGFEIDTIVKARNRRSGQIRSYQLRESIITLKK